MTIWFGPAFEAALTAQAGDYLVASLHTAEPDSTGSDEVTGSGYARQSVTWGTASGGSVSTTALPTFTVPGDTTVSHIGFWDSDESTFYGAIAFDIPEQYGAAGELTVDPAELTAATDPS